MAEALFRIGFAGPHVTIQDPGRPGWARFGVPQSGPMDRLAFRAANTAIGNPDDAAMVEISRGGLQLECLAGEVSFALAGGGFILEHGADRAGSWSRGTLRQGSRMTIRPGHWGNWCYLAFAGRIEAATWLSSQATHSPSGLGGGRLTSGALLRVTDTLTLATPPALFPCPVIARPRRILRAVPGPQPQFFGHATIEDFWQARWAVTGAADRMGTRLSGPSIAPIAKLDMASEPLARGSVQVAGDGVATLLMADHQTTGGYPRIATVLDCDLDAFAQTAPGRRLAFHPVQPEEAITISRAHHRAAERYVARLAESLALPSRSSFS